jgi:GNAT superfamily N-acetyltransferase
MEHYFHIDYKFTHTLEFENSSNPNVEELFGQIFYNDYENEPVRIGEIELHFYNYAFINYDFNIYDAFDRSMNTINLGDAIIDYKTKELKSKIEHLVGDSFNQNILVIHEFILYSEYRNKGFGEEIISWVEKFFSGKCGYIALQSFPKQHDISLKETKRFDDLKLEELNNNFPESQKSLNSFYEKCGFTKVDNESNCYIKNIEPL